MKDATKLTRSELATKAHALARASVGAGGLYYAACQNMFFKCLERRDNSCRPLDGAAPLSAAEVSLLKHVWERRL